MPMSGPVHVMRETMWVPLTHRKIPASISHYPILYLEPLEDKRHTVMFTLGQKYGLIFFWVNFNHCLCVCNVTNQMVVII